MSRRSNRNRHNPIPVKIPQMRRTSVNPEDFGIITQLGAQVLTKIQAQAIYESAQMTKVGIPAGIVSTLAGAGAVVRAVGAAVARHAPPPDKDANLREVLPAWAVDVLTSVGLIPPEAPPAAEETPAAEEEAPRPVEDEQDLVERADAAGLVLAR